MLVGVMVTPVGAGVLAKSHLDLGQRVEDGRTKTKDELERVLDVMGRMEKKQDTFQERFEERQRQIELDVAALKARVEKERSR